MPLTTEQVAALQAGTGQFAGYVPITGNQYSTEAQQNAWQGASPLGVQEYGGSLYGVMPSQGLGAFAQGEDENMDINTGADSTIDTTGGGTNWGQYFQNLYNSSIQNIEQGLLSYNAQQLQANEAAQQAAQTKADEALTGLEGAYEQESGKTLLDRIMKEQGLQEKMDKLTELKSQLAQLEGDFNIANQQIEAKPINAAIIRGQKFLKYREYAARASVIGAQAAIAQEQFSMARDIIQDYYSAATLERENEINRFQTLLSLAKNDVIRLDSEEKDYVNNMISTLQAKQTREKEELNNKMDLLSQAAEFGIDMVSAGVSFDDDLETIFSKIMPMIATETARRQRLSEVGVGGAGVGDITMPEGLSEIEKEAYALASDIYVFEKGGFSEEDWNMQVGQLQSTLKEGGRAISTTQASDLLANALTQYKNTIGTPQLRFDDFGSDLIVPDERSGIEAAGEDIGKIISAPAKQIVKEAKNIPEIITQISMFGIPAGIAKILAEKFIKSNYKKIKDFLLSVTKGFIK